MQHIGSKQMGAASGQGGGKDNKMMLVGLGAVIVVALAGLIYSMVGGKKDNFKVSETIGFSCSKCGEEFQVKRSVYDSIEPAKRMYWAPDCPKCGGKSTGVAMKQCPMCQQWYKDLKDGPDGDKYCPKCNKDFTQWQLQFARDHAPK